MVDTEHWLQKESVLSKNAWLSSVTHGMQDKEHDRSVQHIIEMTPFPTILNFPLHVLLNR